MKIPIKSPDHNEILKHLDREGLTKILTDGVLPYDAKGRYLHYDKLRHVPPSKGLTPDEYWLAMKLERQKYRKEFPFLDKKGSPLYFVETDILVKMLHAVDGKVAGTPTQREQPKYRSGKGSL